MGTSPSRLVLAVATTTLVRFPYPARPGDADRIRAAATRAAAAAHVPMPEVVVAESAWANAFGLGRGRHPGVLVATSGLAAWLPDDRELESVMGHEVSHIKRRHFGKKMAVAVCFLVGMPAACIVAGAAGALARYGIGAEIAAPVASLFAGAHLAAGLDRLFERQADRDAALRIGDPAVAAQALRRLPHAGRRHLPGLPRWHPPIGKRISALDALSAQTTRARQSPSL